MERRRRSRRRKAHTGYGRRVLLMGIVLVLAAGIAGAYYLVSGISVRGGMTGEEQTLISSSEERAGQAAERSAQGEPELRMEKAPGSGEPEQNELEQNELVQNEPDKWEKKPEDLLEEELDRILAAMTTDEKAAQLFIVTPEALTGATSVTQAGNVTLQALKERPVGGLIYFRNNLLSPRQVKELTENTWRYGEETGKLPLILSVDEEGGKVTRIGGREEFDVEVFPDMAQIGAQGDPQKAYETGVAIGAYLKEYGFTMDFAPDADVLTNKENQVIGSRSFGSDPNLVWEMSSQVARGLRAQGILPVYKHFPGHGATLGDTHEGFAYTDKSLDELMESELVPFIKAAEHNEECIMAAHIAAPKITGDETPASLSYELLTGVLREKLGYDGVIVTDALNMGAIQNLYTSSQAAVMAVEAGADLLLMPADFDAAHQAILEAVEDGRISLERLDQSVRRIGWMKLKQKAMWKEFRLE